MLRQFPGHKGGSGYRRKVTSTASRIALLLLLVAPVGAQAQNPALEPLRLLAAGSLTQAIGEVARTFASAPGNPSVDASFGPSGLLRERIERGDARADVFFSASLEHAQLLEQRGHAGPAVVFARNRLCALARPGFVLATDTVLDRMLDPAVRLGTSTPRADPSGDYAWALFARAEVVRPGARAVLEAKALQLVGGANSPQPPQGVGAVSWHMREGRADMFLGYCTSGTQAARELPGVSVVALPDELAVGADYGLALLSPRPEAARLALFALSPTGQAILARHGFAPVSAPLPAPGG